MDSDTHTYYYCKCYIHNEKYVLCDMCSSWMDYVDNVFETHKVDDFKPVVRCKRWVNKKKNNHNQKK